MGRTLKKLILPLILSFSLVPVNVPAENEIDPKDCIPFPADCKKAEVAATALYAVDVSDPQNYDWSSNAEALHVTEDGVFSLFMGKGTLTGVPKDGKGETIKISLSAPTPYFSSKNIVIDSPEGEELIVETGSGFITVGRSGDDCFTSEEIEGRKYGISDAYRIMPKKEGKGAIIYTINMSKQYKINITVKKSALMSEEERQALIEKAGENAKIVIAEKNVNVRADASADADKVGSIKADDEVIVTQPYYTEKWHQILYDGEMCYVSASYLNVK